MAKVSGQFPRMYLRACPMVGLCVSFTFGQSCILGNFGCLAQGKLPGGSMDLLVAPDRGTDPRGSGDPRFWLPLVQWSPPCSRFGSPPDPLICFSSFFDCFRLRILWIRR